ncbi:hypothetical protein LV28_24960 [Pandoraea pnomenusa]|nr:hypothetical protein LV28_24960 [Pandoraea pnomenusa]
MAGRSVGPSNEEIVWNEWGIAPARFQLRDALADRARLNQRDALVDETVYARQTSKAYWRDIEASTRGSGIKASSVKHVVVSRRLDDDSYVANCSRMKDQRRTSALANDTKPALGERMTAC